MDDEPGAQLASALGLADHYIDQLGARVETSAETRNTLMTALGFPPHLRKAALAQLTQWQKGSLPPWLVVSAFSPKKIDIGIDLIRAPWRLLGENEFFLEGRAARTIDLPSLEAGYYTLHVRQTRCLLIVAPPRCYLPPQLDDAHTKAWGLAVQAYGLRSTRNAGFGDFLDIAILAGVLAQKGASFLGLSPLHALFASDRTKISPYSPSSRLFLEPLYLALDVLGCEPLAQGEALRAPCLIDYPHVWSIKSACLEKLYARFESQGLSPAHRRLRQTRGEALERHASFEALSEHFHAQGLMWAGVWPPTYAHAQAHDVAAFQRAQEKRIAFHVWLQLLAEEQLAAAARAAKDSGMAIGLYRDLAVGADRYGSEVWSNRQRYVRDVSVGAPPDLLGPLGQSWGFPPFHPLALQMEDFAPFRELLAANMRHCGALRMDHAFQLTRLFLVPDGAPARDGGYLHYPFEAMLAILRLESQRHGCMVIAEDLGTGPAGFSERIMQDGILSSRILSFERYADGAFKVPQDYPSYALAAMTTHDLPTFRGWRHGFDIDLRATFGVFSEREARREHGLRREDQKRWHAALAREAIPSDLTNDVAAHNDALRFLAHTPSLLLGVQNEDALDEINQPNLPGVFSGPPNWRRRMSETIEAAARDNGPYARLGALMAQESRSARPRQARLAADPPIATYRLQLNHTYTFAQAQAALPYLKSLGISHLYVSPIQTSRTGSLHGYDIVDPQQINPELGGLKAFLDFSQTLHAMGLKLIVDIVPNHMTTDADNPFWWSVLLQGRASDYARVFDIDWARGQDKIVLPVLRSPYGEALRGGDFKIAYNKDERSATLHYFDHVFPIAFDALDEDLVLYPQTPARLHALLERQHYRLASWRLCASDLNYRRFFEINNLVGVRVEDEHVFELTHRALLDLIAQGHIDGLRVDHIDGLADPARYLALLQKQVGPGFPIYVEKILGRDEALRDWPVAGTTGYDALNEIDGVLLDQRARAPIESFYREVIDPQSSASALQHAKLEILEGSFGSELTAFVQHLGELAAREIETRDLSALALRRALCALIVALPVYRIYGAETDDQRSLDHAEMDARAGIATADHDALAFLLHLLRDPAEAQTRVRFGQLTGPVMAKGLEDTFYYRHAPFLVLNEVGGSPDKFGFSVDAFHEANRLRTEYWPASLVATATHDTKRGEDSRARLLALTAVPEHFLQNGRHFLQLVPDMAAGDAWLLFQSLIGAWPLDEQADLEPRMAQFLRKALREARLRSSWADPDEAYEDLCLQRLRHVLADGEARELISEMVGAVQWAGILNGLARTILKLTLPGVPDFYQGTELWDFALVDPDNRRPVDYAAREALLQAHQNTRPQQLLADWRDGAIKQWLIAKLLALRARHQSLFAFGAYEANGSPGLSFTRRFGRELLHVELFTGTQMLRDKHVHASGTLCAPELWRGVHLTLPKGRWRNQLTGTAFDVQGKLSAVDIAEGLPWLILGTTQ